MLVLLQKEGRKRREGGRKKNQTAIQGAINMVSHGGWNGTSDLSHVASAGLRSLLDSI